MIYPSQASQWSQRFTGLRFARPSIQLEPHWQYILGEYQAQADVADQLAADIQKKLNELKSRDDEIGKLKQEMARLKTMREAVQRKLQNSEESRIEIEQKRDTLKSQLIALEKVCYNYVTITSLVFFRIENDCLKFMNKTRSM